MELWREIFEVAIGETDLLDPLFEPQNQRLRLHHFLQNGNSTGHTHPSDVEGAYHSSALSSSITTSSSASHVRGASTSRHSPSLSTSSNRISPPLSSSSTGVGARMLTSLRTKLAISATSSQWRKIGLSYLFRNVTFMSLHQLQLLTGLVRASRYRYVPGPHNIRLLLEGEGIGYGALIRRIESTIDRESLGFRIVAFTDT